MKAYELLSDKGRWTQNSYAKNANGFEVCSISPTATCWCILGAIHKCYAHAEIVYTKGFKLRKRLGMHPDHWNDAPERTFEEVQNLLKELDI